MSNKNISSCSKYNECNAPLCPEINNPDVIWYPDEEICRCRKHSPLSWVRKQRKIARKTVYRDCYFTIADLERIRRITQKTKGHDPDSDKGNDTLKIPRFYDKTPSNEGEIIHNSVRVTKTTNQGSDTFKTPLKHNLKPYLSGYPKTLSDSGNTLVLKPIDRQDSDIEH